MILATLEDVLTQYLALSPADRAAFNDDFLSLMTEAEYRRFMRKIGQLSVDDRRKSSGHLSKVIDNVTVRTTIRNISEVREDLPIKKEDILNAIELFSNSARTPTKHVVAVHKRMIVHVNFAGLGQEFLGNHPAIVWHTVGANADRMVVIPCTSYKSDTTTESSTSIFIGKGKFFASDRSVEAELSKDTVVLLDQMQVVSRKRITRYNDPNPLTGNPKTARLDDQQTRRIEEGIKIAYLGYQTLYDLYVYPYTTDRYFDSARDEGYDIPVFPTTTMVPQFSNPDFQYLHLYRLVHDVLDAGCFISYKVEDDPNTYYMFRRPTSTTLSQNERELLLKKWYLPKAVKNPDKTVRHNTAAVRQQAYQDLLSKKCAIPTNSASI